MLSGFLITTLLVEEYASRGRIALGAFYLRRVLRLVPALVTMLAGVVIYVSIAFPHPGRVYDEVLATLAYGDNWYRVFAQMPSTLVSHAWSLSIEEQFYLTWPILLLLALRLRGLNAAFGFSVATTVACVLWRVDLWDRGASVVRVYNGFDTRLDGLAIGCMLALALKLGYAQRIRALLRLAFYPALAVIAYTLEELGSSSSATYLYGLFVFSVAVAVALFDLVDRQSWLRSLLAWGPAVYVGRISYALYLWHYPVLIALERTPLTHNHAHLLDLVLSLLLAIASYSLVEQPFLRLKARLGSREGRAAATTGPRGSSPPTERRASRPPTDASSRASGADRRGRPPWAWVASGGSARPSARARR